MRSELSAFLRTRVAKAAALTASALLAVTCHSEPTSVCAPTNLVITTQPTNVAAGSGISLTAEAHDNSGTLQTCYTGNVTVSIGTNPGGGSLSGTTTVAASGGVATFSGLTLTKAGAGYTLVVNGASIATSATSSAFTISAGPATALTITTQPTNAQAGGTIGPAVVVTVIDQFGNTASGFAGTVAVAITAGTGTAGAVLSGTTSVTAAAGLATFSTLKINKTGAGYTLTATATGLVSVASTAFNISPGPTTQLVFTTQPSNVAAGGAITPAVVVTAQDAQGNTTTAFVGAVTVAIGTNPATGVLSGTKTVNAVAGVATFSTLNIDKPGTGYTLTASSGILTNLPSSAFNVTVGVLSQLIFTQQPTSAVAGVGIAPAMIVTAQDAVGNAVTTFNGNVTLTIGTNPSGGTLSGTATVAAVAGVATFTGVNIDKAGAGYKLTATAGAVSVQSAAFTISAAPPTQLVFTTQPVQTAAGATIPTVVVTAEDQFNNVATAFANAVTVAISSGTGKAGAVLSGTKTVTAAAGIAAFATLSIDSVGTNYTLTATATGLVGGFASASFNIVPNVATVLVFTAQPSNKTAGLAIAPSVVVTARDAKGNTATGFTGNVTMSITAGTGTAGAVLGGTPTVAAVAGIATFANLRVSKSGAGYTLTASGTALTPDTSAAFNITPGTATKVAFTVQPTSQTAGVAIAPAIQVTAQDSLGNTDTAFAGSITLAITAATGTSGANLTGGGATAVTAHTGIATFAGVSIDSAGANYTLSATGTGALTGAPSTAFNIRPGAATQLAFTVQPSNQVAGIALAPAVKVTARDALGNTDTTFKTAITLAITPATGTTGANLSGGVVTAASGVATFAALSIDSVGTGYTLSASAAGPITGGPSSTFDITPGTAIKLAFVAQPTNATAGPPAQIPVFQVAAQDVLGNTASAFNGNITVAIGANPGGGSLGGTLIVAAVNGVASYGDLSINKSGTGYKLQATSGALSPAASASFDIVAGTATKLTFTVEPVNTQAGDNITPAVQVSGQDALGNTDLTYTGSVAIAIGTNPPGTGVLTGTTPVNAVAGVASFSDLNINVVGNGYTLNASASGVTGTSSATFNIIPNTVDHLVFTQGPTSATAGVAISPAVVVTAFDASNNVATQFTGGMTLAITPATGTAGAHLSHAPSVTVNAVLGVATFTTLSVDSAGTGYTLDASGPALLTSGSFNITPAPASALEFTVQPGTAVAGANNALVVTARDSLGNRATSFGSLVTLAINSGPAGGTILSGGTATAVAGIASFNALRNDKVGAYTLNASAAGPISGGPSSSYNVTPDVAAALFFTGQPHTAVAGANNSPAIVVEARDAFANVATGFAGLVTLSAASGPAASFAGNTATASAGIATFANFTIDKTGTFTLNASAAGPIAGGPSSAFVITPDVAVKLVFTTNPAASTTAGQTMAAVVVTAQDANSNTATAFTGTVTLGFANNPGGGGLGGTLIKAATAGVVTFNDLSINIAATGYKLQATSPLLTQGQSSSFDITADAATQLVFTGLPVTPAIAGLPLRPGGAEVTAQDQFGNTDPTFTGTITLSRLSGPVTQLFGDTTIAAVAGVATFTDVNIHLAATGYTLRAAFTGLVSGNSNLFDIRAAPATHLLFAAQPSNQTAGVAISPAIEVTALDQFNNLDSGFAGGAKNVTLSINTGPAAALQNETVTPANGRATFTNFNVQTSGAARTLNANGGGLTTPVPSGPFTITAAAANHVEFTVQPSSVVAGVNISPSIQVTAKDQFNNIDLGFNPGGGMALFRSTFPSGGDIIGGFALSDPIANGVATFPAVALNKVGAYTLQVLSGLPIVVSGSFNVTPAGADHFTFTVQPTDVVAGANISPAIVVEARDFFDNLATGFTGAGHDMELSVFTGAGAVLSGGTVTASNGVGTFASVSIDLAGAHTLAVTSVDCACAFTQSGSFTVNPGTATQLGFSQQPSNTAANVAISPDVAVAAQDQFGNTVPSFTGTVTISIGTNPAPGGTLSGTLSQPFASGVATFAGLSIDQVNTGYRLLATSSPVLTQKLSALFDIN